RKSEIVVGGEVNKLAAANNRGVIRYAFVDGEIRTLNTGRLGHLESFVKRFDFRKFIDSPIGIVYGFGCWLSHGGLEGLRIYQLATQTADLNKRLVLEIKQVEIGGENVANLVFQNSDGSEFSIVRRPSQQAHFRCADR